MMNLVRVILFTACLTCVVCTAPGQDVIPLDLAKRTPAMALPAVSITPPAADAVLAAFAQHIRTLDSVDDAQRAASLKRMSQPDSEAILDVLRSIYPPFRAAAAALGDEQTDKAIALLQPLFDHADPYLAAYARYFAARAYVMRQDYEQARPLLAEIAGKSIDKTLHSGEALFMLGVCGAQLLERDTALATLTEFCDKYPDASERMTVGAVHLIDELSRIDEGTLSDVQTRMDYSRRRLALAHTADRTQDEQARIITILNKLIAEAEQREQQGGGGGSGGASGGLPGGQGPAGGGPGGATQSTAPVGPAITGAVHQTHRGRPDEQWGAMPDKQRDDVLSALKAKYPERYRELVEQYYRSLQEESP